ncbi:hypothetical protein BGW37DRAFT_107935 [Umbelopsis sp. PMI_123]|nr:hypothetical protein BGW37DRAFT_107935 [Umbelopsis sp. PMI_123]
MYLTFKEQKGINQNLFIVTVNANLLPPRSVFSSLCRPRKLLHFFLSFLFPSLSFCYSFATYPGLVGCHGVCCRCGTRFYHFAALGLHCHICILIASHQFASIRFGPRHFASQAFLPSLSCPGTLGSNIPPPTISCEKPLC